MGRTFRQIGGSVDRFTVKRARRVNRGKKDKVIEEQSADWLREWVDTICEVRREMQGEGSNAD